MFTRQHYKAIAHAIDINSKGNTNLIHKDSLILELCAYFQEDNPNFDRNKFITACFATSGD